MDESLSAERIKALETELAGALALQRAIQKGDWPHTMDAHVWATEFLKRFPNGGYDHADIMTWFANAIMAGYDRANLARP